MKSNATFNHVLTLAATEYSVNEAEYAAGALAPVFRVGVQAATYPKWSRENMLNVPNLKARAAGAPYPRLDMEIGEDVFATRDYGLELPLDDRQKAIYASALDADRGKINRGSRVLMLNKERRVHALATGAGVPNSSPADKWNDYAAGDPIGDIDAIKEVIHDNCGLEANVGIIPRAVFNILKEHPQILEKIKYTQRGIITADLIAAVFGLSRIVVAGATQNTANEGQAVSIGKVWGDSVIIAHVNSAQDLETPTFLRTFAWSGYTRATGEFAVETYRENNPPATIHQLKHDVDERVVAAACGYHLSDVLN